MRRKATSYGAFSWLIGAFTLATVSAVQAQERDQSSLNSTTFERDVSQADELARLIEPEVLDPVLLGSRQTVETPTVNVNPLKRVDNRLQNRLNTRLVTRIPGRGAIALNTADRSEETANELSRSSSTALAPPQ